MGVVVRRYIDILIIIITFPYSTCISSFFGSSIPTVSALIMRRSKKIILLRNATLEIWLPKLRRKIRKNLHN